MTSVKNIICIIMIGSVSKFEVILQFHTTKYLKLSPRDTKNVIMLGAILIAFQTIFGLVRDHLDTNLVATVINLHMTFAIICILATLDNFKLQLT